jgi:CubicO group peptidase (beta-lactamase class C family)
VFVSGLPLLFSDSLAIQTIKTRRDSLDSTRRFAFRNWRPNCIPCKEIQHFTGASRISFEAKPPGEFMKRIAVLAFLALVVLHPSRTLASQAQADEINSLMTAARKVGVFNGTVLVNYKDKLIYQAALGYADSTRTRELTDESRFYIGSIDKEFSGAGLLLLKQQGKLKLEDKVSLNISRNIPGPVQSRSLN